MTDPLLTLTGGLLLIAVAVAPWALACQPPSATHWLEGGLGLAALCRMAAAMLRPRSVGWPRLPGSLWAMSAALLVVGWIGVARAGAVAVGTRTPAADLSTVARAEMVFVTTLVLAVVLAADLGRDRRWRRWAGWTVWGTAAAVAVVGTVLHLNAARGLCLPDPYARFMSDKQGTPFGPFNYHANAGAFLNLALPLAVLGGGVAPAVGAVVIGVGAAVNVSRGAQAVTAIELLACGVVAWTRWRRLPGRSPAGRRWPAYAAAGLVALAVVAVGARQSARRWSTLSAAVQSDSSRPLLWRVCGGMARSAGWAGYGPGTFKLLFPRSPHLLPQLYSKYIVQDYTPGTRVSMWNHVHDDYLQCLIEWGWPGTALWSALFAGGLWAAIGRARTGDRFAAAVAIALAGVLLHALVDFPLQVEVIRLNVAVLLGLAWSAGGWPPDAPARPLQRAGHLEQTVPAR